MANSTLDWLLAAGAAGGIIWYVNRSQRTSAVEAEAAKRLAKVAEARAGIAAAVAHGERALAAGNAAAATLAATAAAAAAHSAGHVSPPPTTVPPPPTAPPPPGSSRPPPGLTRRFDDLFARHGDRIPVPYLRVLANAESGMRPNDPLGLINITSIALADFNRRHPETVIKAAQMRDPATNIRVAADTLRQIIGSYERNHDDLPNLRTDWTNPRFVQLLTLGWNAGHSELSGVGRVLRYLKAQPAAQRPTDITIDAVFAAARAAQATEHLSNRRKLDYSKGVAAAFAREVERDARDRAYA